MDFAQTIEDARKSTGLSFRKAAEQIGISASYLQYMEIGKNKPPMPTVLAGMARTYGLDYEMLMRLAGRSSAERIALIRVLSLLINNEPIDNVIDYVKGTLAPAG